ncbi:MAG: hypothetical protein HY703_11590 [Gemmatimonadetes bacterium]|nr:hypothetical protein [Gemmatimonadota bacterium]
MMNMIERYSERHREEAIAELRAELADFSHDGLVQLKEDLVRGGVVRGSWAGCVMSYKRGAPGSARRDRLGRARNAFTVLWDNGWLTDEEVLSLVEVELTRRRTHLPLPAPAPERLARAAGRLRHCGSRGRAGRPLEAGGSRGGLRRAVEPP